MSYGVRGVYGLINDNHYQVCLSISCLEFGDLFYCDYTAALFEYSYADWDMSKATVNVAIAILLHRGNILVGWREAKQHQGNKHEFPGGKLEAAETPEMACRREVLEEVGIDIAHWHVFDHICHEYDDLIVNLHVFHAVVQVEQLDHIQSPWTWVKREELRQLNFPKANLNLIQRLSLATYIKISANFQDIQHLQPEQWMYFRPEKTIDWKHDLEQLENDVLNQMIVPFKLWQDLSMDKQLQVAAVHLKQNELEKIHREQLQQGVAYIAACHDLESALKAQQIGCDAIFLSPVLPTQTHPEQLALGWERFGTWAAQLDIAVFALGGMTMDDLDQARQHHAYGIAGISHF